MSEVPEWVYERVRRGDFASVSEALEAAGRALDVVEYLDPAALQSEVLAIRREGADDLRVDLQLRLDELGREGISAPIAEIVLWERRLKRDEQELLVRLRAEGDRQVTVEDQGALGGEEPARIISRLLRDHVTRWLVPIEFAEAVMERVRAGRYTSVEHTLYAAIAALELLEVDPGASERLRDLLAGIDEQLERGPVATGDEAIGLVRRRTILGELLARGVDGSGDPR
jgi:hypothetical protein